MKKTIFSYVAISMLALLITSSVQKTKHVLIIGDSISIGYTPFIKDALSPDDIIVEHNPGNGGSTKRGVESIEKWLDNKEWDVIVFNFGLHDLVHKDSLNKYDVNGIVSITPEEYEKNLNFIVGKLKETTATIFFATTTTVPEGASGRKVESPAIYNEIATKVMNKNKINIIDLYTASLEIHPKNSKPKNVHYTPNGYEELSKYIVDAIRPALK